jgi:quercetin dioxygenase-like cupin family protein
MDAPEVRLLDARAADLDEAGLREWARAETAACGEPCVSRSYRYPFALVAWHSEPVGVDIERVEPLGPEFADSICTPEERSESAAAADSDAYLTSLWCSKEALSKALGDALRYDPRRLGSPQRWPDGRAGPWRAKQIDAPERHTAWICWRDLGYGLPARGAGIRRIGVDERTDAMPDQAVVRGPGEGRAFWMLGGLYELKVSSEESNGAMTVMDMTIPAGMGPPPHTHPGSETVYVMEGRIRYHIDGETFDGVPGSCFHIPPEVMENFEPIEQSRILVVYAPGGIERFFAEAGEPAERFELPPPPTEPPDMERLVALGEQYGMRIGGPAPV